MNKIYALIAVLLFTLLSHNIYAQALTGTKTIPGDYSTIKDAITDLNTKDVGTGGVTFNITAGYTETITAALSVTATGTASNPVIFQKSGTGTNPLITAYTTGTGTPSSAVQDGIWNLIGSDYITIDGIDLLDPNTANPATMEYGFGLFKKSTTDGCQNNTIKNCVVTLSRNNNAAGGTLAVDGSRAINVVNSLVTTQITNVTPTTSAGANSFNKFYHNTLQNCNYGISIIGYAGSTPFTACDFGNDVGGTSAATGNNIINFGGGMGAVNPSAGVRTLAQHDLNISYNTVNNNNGSGVNHTTTLRGLYINTAVSASITVNNNTLSISGGTDTMNVSAIENASGGTAAGNTININNNTISNCNWTTATTGKFYGIYNTSVSTAATVNISNNTFTSITHTGSGADYFINQAALVGTLNINANTFNNLSLATTGNVYLITNATAANNNIIMSVSNNTITGTFAKTGSGGNMYGFYNSGSSSNGTATINSNNFSNVTLTGASAFYGIYHVNSTINANQTHIITNNTISSITGSASLHGIFQGCGDTASVVSGNTVSGFTGADTIVGISVGNVATPYSLSVYGNNVSNLITTGTVVFGIEIVKPLNVYKNRIFNLESNNASGKVFGIQVGTGITGTVNIYNNFISDLRTPIANTFTLTSPTLAGINTIGGLSQPINIYYNTIYLNASNSGTDFGSAGVYAYYAKLDLRNNIIVNQSVQNGTGYTAAFMRYSSAYSTSTTYYLATSNSNLYYAGTPSAKKVIFFNGTAYQTLASFKTLVGPSRDSISVTELPPFVNVSSTPYNLHINPSLPSLCESGARRITTPISVTNDFDLNPRWGETGYTGSGTAPDIGADEFDSTNTGNIIIASEVPASYKMYGNYPNPFNPTTSINYDIPKSTYVKLSVYDITGKEVETLVNKNLQAGKYRADWNASRYSSGIYFARIETGDYRHIIKMIMVK